MAGSAAIEGISERVEIGLQVFRAQAVGDPERPGLEVREHAVNPGQYHMRGHGADDPRIMVDPGGAGVGRPTVGLGGGGRGD